MLHVHWKNTPYWNCENANALLLCVCVCVCVCVKIKIPVCKQFYCVLLSSYTSIIYYEDIIINYETSITP
jgi:hypothetical protein